MVYYMSDALFDTAQKSSVTAFKPGFRMLVGDVNFRNREQARDFRQLTYICMQNEGTREPETLEFPKQPCPSGIMANHRFPTCWDGVNVDSPNHRDHVAYPETGTFESGGKCPSTHPVRLPQILLETVWDTRQFNNKADWPADGSQPFVWSSGDSTGYSTHADYLFGWKDDSLQKHLDGHTYVTAPTLKTQSIANQNKCTVKDMVGEDYDSCKFTTSLPHRSTSEQSLTCYRAHCFTGQCHGEIEYQVTFSHVKRVITLIAIDNLFYYKIFFSAVPIIEREQ